MHLVYWVHDEQSNALSKMTWCRGINSCNRYKPHIFTLDGNNTMRASLPLLSLGEVTARYEPKTKHFSHCKNHRSSWPNKTQDSERLTRISNHAYKNSEKNQIIFIDKLVHKSTIHRISTNTSPKRITSDRSPWRSWRTLYWRSKREKKPSSY